MWKKIQPFLVSVALAFLVGGLSYLASGFLGTSSNQMLYESLNLPAGAPPASLFGVVWPLWYLLLGIAAAIVYRSPTSVAKSEGLRFYELQLLILFTWPILFFRLQSYWAAFTLLLLLVFVLYMMLSRYYQASKAAFWILTPYAAWIAYALWLNLRVAMLN